MLNRPLASISAAVLIAATAAGCAPAAPAAPTPTVAPKPAAAAPTAASPSPAAKPATSPSPAAPQPAGRIVATHTLPDLPIAAFQNGKLPGSMANDRRLLLGGVGSDLWRGAADPQGEFWLITDRGPNGQVRVENTSRRTFPIPDYNPAILRVKAEGSALTILETLPILGQAGKPVGGLPNIDGFDEIPYDYAAQARLAFNPNGLDTEGLVRTGVGDFWIAEEYSPSLAKIDRTGKLVKRYIPEGLALQGADYPVSAALPAIYARRKVNRGFEGLAMSKDEKKLYLALQSPLLVPDAKTGNASRNTRIIEFDVATERVVAEYVYRFDPVTEFDPGAKGPEEMKLSGAIALTPDTLLVLERTDWVAKLYTVDLRQATNILGSKWDDPATAPSLEALEDLAAAQVKVLPKSLVLDLESLPSMPDKIEGVAVIDRDTIAVINDNDFDVGDFDTAGNNVGKGVKSQLLVIALPRPLPGP